MARPALDFTPRGLRAPGAAAYLGMSERKFLDEVRAGRAPKPRRLDRMVIWDRRDLDNYFETLPREGDADDDWDEDVAI